MSTEKTTAPTSAVTKTTNKFTEATVNNVLSRIAEIQATGEIVLPENYVPENAVRAAWLVLQGVVDRNGKPALDVCTKESIANAFLDMVTSGLSVSKKQGYFVVYGDKLQFDQSYLGDIAIAKRVANVKEVNAVTIYKDDEFEYEVDFASGRKKVISHKQKLVNIQSDKIVGAYAIVTYNDGSSDAEIMTLDQIKKSWEMGGSKGNSKAHNNFPDQMCEKTVTARALKVEIASSDDRGLLSDKTNHDVKHEISQNANREVIDFDHSEDVTSTAQVSETESHEPEMVGEEAPSKPGF